MGPDKVGLCLCLCEKLSKVRLGEAVSELILGQLASLDQEWAKTDEADRRCCGRY